MNPEQLTAALRPRSVWESVDFGFAAARRWWKPVWAAWLLGYTPLFALTWLLLHDLPWLAVPLLWWLKPLVGRLPLWVLGSALFGDTPDLGRVARAAPRLLTAHLVSTLTWLRIMPWRSFHAPVAVLEGGSGAEQARRRRVLVGVAQASGIWLTLSCFVLKWVLFWGILGAFFVLVPDRPELSPSEAFYGLEAGEPPLWLMSLFLFADFAAMSLIEPLYVAGGFGLYINRRSDLEGWDVAIAFHRLARRVARVGGATALALLLLISPARAQLEDSGDTGGAIPAAYVSSEALDQTVEEVLADEEFGAKTTAERWQVREDLDLPKIDLSGCNYRPQPETPPPSFCGAGVGAASQGGLFVVLGLALVVLVFVILRRIDRPRPKGPASGPRPEPSQGVSALPEDLPDDLATQAWLAWTQGKQARALGMLYKGALVKLIERGLPINDGMTEGEARRLVRRRAEAEVSEIFDQLTRVWQLAAYAHRMPDDDTVRALCDAWPGAFE